MISKIIKIPAVTISVAIPLENFFDNLSTMGFKEHAITNDAKNIIAISLHLKIKNKKRSTTIVKVIFLKFKYLLKITLNIFLPRF